jgi:hypothetical protein
MAKQSGTRSASDGPEYAVRNVVGDTPTCLVNVVVKEPTLLKPTSRQISATDSPVVRSRWRARSSRRLIRY